MKKIILTLMLIISLITSVYALTVPHAFYGTAKYQDGSTVPDGTVITAKLNGESVDTATVQDGKYGYGDDTLVVTDDAENGGTITFHIGDVDADQETEFESAKAEELDLTFPGTAPEETTNEETTTSSGSSGSSGGSSGGSGGGGGGSSGGGGGGSSSSKPKTTENPVVEETTTTQDKVEEAVENEDLEFHSVPTDLDERLSGSEKESNFLTGAFAGALSKTSGKLGLISGIFLALLLGLGLFKHVKKKKQA